MASRIVDSAAVDIVGIILLVFAISALAIPVAFVIYIIYKILDNR